MKALKLIAQAESWIGNRYKAAGKRFDDMSEAVWKRIKPGAIFEKMPKKIREKIKQMKSKDIQNANDKDVKLITCPNKISNDLKSKFNEEVTHGRIPSENN
jgi:hypothetical protein